MIRFYNGPVLTLQQDQMNITHQEVWVDGNRIVCLGANPGAKADREIDLNGDLLMPAFKNAHTHSAMTFGRSFSDDLPLQSWLYDKIFPLEAKLTAEEFIICPDWHSWSIWRAVFPPALICTTFRKPWQKRRWTPGSVR